MCISSFHRVLMGGLVMRFSRFRLPMRLMMVVFGVVAFGPAPMALADDTQEAALDAAASTGDVQTVALGDDRRPRPGGWVHGWHWRAEASDRRSRYRSNDGPGWRTRMAAPYGYGARADGAGLSDRSAATRPSYQRYSSGRPLSYSERRLLADEALIRRQPWRSVPADSWEGQRWRDRQVGLNWR
jgi:hypothetical protein